MDPLRKTKVIATLGKSTLETKQIKELLLSGVDGFRIGMRFLSPDEKTRAIRNIREAEALTGIYACVVLSLRESDMRIGNTESGTQLQLKEGQEVKIVSDSLHIKDSGAILCNNRDLHKLVKPGDKLLLEFGIGVLSVIAVENVYDKKLKKSYSHQTQETKDFSRPIRYPRFKPKAHKGPTLIRCKVENDCTFDGQTPINFSSPNHYELEASNNDLEDIRMLEWANENDVDVIVYKQFRGKEDIEAFWNFRVPKGCKRFLGVQTKESALMCEEFLSRGEGCSIGRGALGVETSVAEVCSLQKQFIKLSTEKGKPVIVSTQMLESMVSNQKPTRAEVNDVFTAAYDGADSILLSGETAYGKHPQIAVKACFDVCMEAEKHIPYQEVSEGIMNSISVPLSIAEDICYCAVKSVVWVGASLITCITKSGKTAQTISKFRPSCMILAITNNLKVLRFLRIVRGVFPALIKEEEFAESYSTQTLEIAKEKQLVQSGEKVVYVGGGRDSFVEGDTSSLKINIVP